MAQYEEKPRALFQNVVESLEIQYSLLDPESFLCGLILGCCSFDYGLKHLVSVNYFMRLKG